MCIEINSFNTPRISRKSLHAIRQNQTTYRIEPWGQSMSQLPLIIMRPQKQRNTELPAKKLISNTEIIQKSKDQIICNPIQRHKSIHIFSCAKNKIYSKYNSSSYQQKQIKTIDFVKQQPNFKVKLKKKLSKNQLKGRSKNNSEFMPSKLSNLGHSSSLSKVGKYIEIERKIFLMASKEKL